MKRAARGDSFRLISMFTKAKVPMRKLPRQYSGFVMGAVMAIAMGFIMSSVVTFLNVGFVDNFFQKWMVAFLGVLPIGLPIAIVVTPIIKSFIDRMSE